MPQGRTEGPETPVARGGDEDGTIVDHDRRGENSYGDGDGDGCGGSDHHHNPRGDNDEEGDGWRVSEIERERLVVGFLTNKFLSRSEDDQEDNDHHCEDDIFRSAVTSGIFLNPESEEEEGYDEIEEARPASAEGRVDRRTESSVLSKTAEESSSSSSVAPPSADRTHCGVGVGQGGGQGEEEAAAVSGGAAADASAKEKEIVGEGGKITADRTPLLLAQGGGGGDSTITVDDFDSGPDPVGRIVSVDSSTTSDDDEGRKMAVVINNSSSTGGIRGRMRSCFRSAVTKLVRIPTAADSLPGPVLQYLITSGVFTG